MFNDKGNAKGMGDNMIGDYKQTKGDMKGGMEGTRDKTEGAFDKSKGEYEKGKENVPKIFESNIFSLKKLSGSKTFNVNFDLAALLLKHKVPIPYNQGSLDYTNQ